MRVLCAGCVGVLKFIILTGRHSILMILHTLPQHGQFWRDLWLFKVSSSGKFRAAG